MDSLRSQLSTIDRDLAELSQRQLRRQRKAQAEAAAAAGGGGGGGGALSVAGDHKRRHGEAFPEDPMAPGLVAGSRQGSGFIVIPEAGLASAAAAAAAAASASGGGRNVHIHRIAGDGSVSTISVHRDRMLQEAGGKLTSVAAGGERDGDDLAGTLLQAWQQADMGEKVAGSDAIDPAISPDGQRLVKGGQSSAVALQDAPRLASSATVLEAGLAASIHQAEALVSKKRRVLEQFEQLEGAYWRCTASDPQCTAAAPRCSTAALLASGLTAAEEDAGEGDLATGQLPLPSIGEAGSMQPSGADLDPDLDLELDLCCPGTLQVIPEPGPLDDSPPVRQQLQRFSRVFSSATHYSRTVALAEVRPPVAAAGTGTAPQQQQRGRGILSSIEFDLEERAFAVAGEGEDQGGIRQGPWGSRSGLWWPRLGHVSVVLALTIRSRASGA